MVRTGGQEDRLQDHVRYYEIAGITVQVESDLPITDATCREKFDAKFMGPEGGWLFACGAGRGASFDVYGLAQPGLGVRAPELTVDILTSSLAGAPECFAALQRGCEDGELVCRDLEQQECDHMYHCGAGNGSFNLGYDGTYRLCSLPWHPCTTYALRQGVLREAREEWVPRVRDTRGKDPAFLAECRRCALIDLCLRCPARAALETGPLDDRVEYFCAVEDARAAALQADAGSRAGAETAGGAEPPE